jgi:hypothetical protein
MNTRIVLSAICVAVLSSRVGIAQEPAGSTPATNVASPTAVPASLAAEDLKQLRETIAEQAAQIKRLQEAVDRQQKLLERTLASTNAQPATATPTVAVASTADGTSVVNAGTLHLLLLVSLMRLSTAARPTSGAASEPISVAFRTTRLRTVIFRK